MDTQGLSYLNSLRKEVDIQRLGTVRNSSCQNKQEEAPWQNDNSLRKSSLF
nr:MAG TPA: hypothetical protein [Caudoviricetes sp.]